MLYLVYVDEMVEIETPLTPVYDGRWDGLFLATLED